MKTKLSNKELNELLEWFGLSDKEIHITLEDDIKGVMDKYYDEHQEHEKKKREFISLFKECYSDIVKIMELDPHKRVAVNCFTCIKGMDLSKQYVKPKVSKWIVAITICLLFFCYIPNKKRTTKD